MSYMNFGIQREYIFVNISALREPYGGETLQQGLS